MSKIRLGLSEGIVSAPAFEDINDLFLPAETVMKKAGQGFSRGPKAGHKYWRRQRVIIQGKLKWRYYYNTEKDRKQWVEDRAKLLKRKRASITAHEKRSKKNAEESHDTGHTRSEHAQHHPNIGEARRELDALTVEYVNTILSFDNPPNVIVSEAVREEYMRGIEAHFGSEGDPEDPHGSPIHALRGVEHAFRALPPSVRHFFDGDLKTLVLTTAKEDPQIKRRSGGFCRYLGNGKSEIRIALDNCGANRSGGISEPYPDKPDEKAGRHGMRGGAFLIECMVHEIAHSWHNRMGAYSDADAETLRSRGWDRATWADWGKFIEENSNPLFEHGNTGRDNPGRNKVGKRGGERGITAYANTNWKERWAESFTACLLYPHQMAAKCPKTYDWFRDNVFGPETMHPRVTDRAAIQKIEDALSAAGDADERRELRAQLDMATGLDEIPSKDERLQWWKGGQPSELQQGLTKARADNESFRPPHAGAGVVHRVDPPDMDTTGLQKLPGRRKYHDRFYEMNYKGRTIYVRYGPTADGSFKQWEPNVPGKTPGFPPLNAKGKEQQVSANVANIKEVYDEDGNPIHPNLMYLHLVQDDLVDGAVVARVKPTGSKKAVEITTADLRQYLIDPSMLTKTMRDVCDKQFGPAGSKAGAKFLRSFTRPGLHDELSEDVPKLQALYAELNGLPEGDPKREALSAEIRALEDKLNDANWDQIGATKGGMPMPITMTPHEMTLREFKQRSGTFAYDQIQVKGQSIIDELEKHEPGSKKHTKLLNALRKEQPGVALTNRRDPKTGKFRRGNVRLDRKGRPVFNTLRYINENPDGSQTIIDTVRDPKTGKFTLQNPLWRDLLTPNNEEIRNAEDLQRVMQHAASQKRRTWVSLRTDRRRIPSRTGKSFKLEKTGDTGHHFHIEVEFDGAGQPKIIGDYWKQILGKDNPRLDDLIEDDPMFGRLGGRAVIQGEAIRMKKEKQPDPFSPDNPPKLFQRVILSVTGAEQRSVSAKDKDVIATVVKVIPGKKAGELPPAPNWDAMPEGFPPLNLGSQVLSPEEADKGITQNIPKKNKALRAKIRKLKREGVLPPWYSHNTREAAWYARHYEPAVKEWNRTKEAKRQEAYETQYVFRGATGGGAAGQTFTRSQSEVFADLRQPESALVPEPLEAHTLAYMHSTVDPRSGMTLENEIRLVAPKSGQPTLSALVSLPGCEGLYQTVKNPLTGKTDKVLIGVSVKADRFHLLRNALGGLSITDDVNRLLANRYATAKAAEMARREESHVIEQESIDPKNLRRQWGVKLNETLPNGADFTLGIHQQKLLQKMLDNDGRVLACHYMGTGKTVSALSAAQIMLRRPYRPEIPKELAGEERQKWLEENPWDTSRLHPDNPKRVLVVAPLNTVEQWRQSAYDFDDGAQVVGSGSNDIPIDQFTAMQDDQRAEIVVVGPEYFTLHADKLKACGFDGLIIDEVHMGIKNEDAERNKKVREWNDDMKMMMLLTGTPMTTHPADFVEYIRLLSKGAVFGDMTKKKFIEEYCVESDIPGKTGAPGAGPKVKIKPEKMAELAAILDQYMDIALPKDVRGKTLPATRVAEGRVAAMRGIQETLFNLYMGTAGDEIDPDIVSDDELETAQKKTSTAKALANCVGFKPSSDDPYIMVEVKNPETGNFTKVPFETLNPGSLKRGKLPRWPNIQALEAQYGSARAATTIMDSFCAEVLGAPYSMLAGQPIGFGIQINGKPEDPFKLPVSKAQRAEAFRRMEEAGWPHKLDNPDRGPLGIRFRGNGISLLEELANKGKTAELAALRAKLDLAAQFQRAYRRQLQIEMANPVVSKKNPPPDPEDVLHAVASQFGVSDPYELLYMNPNPIRVETDNVVLTHGGQDVVMRADETWVSDQSGSRHLLYEEQDWDGKNNQPKSAGPVNNDTPIGTMIGLSEKFRKGLGHVPPAKPKKADFKGKGSAEAFAAAQRKHEEMLRQWHPPKYQLVGLSGKTVQVRIMSGPDAGTLLAVPVKDTQVGRPSLMDPGRRESRRRADMAMVHQNGKADELEEAVQRFHAGEHDGPEGKRQMVLFGNGILDSCRTMEAKMRQMGFVDVNEALEGSPHFDPTDPVTKGDPPSPTGKYFVTYIGATHTGNRELNVSIFQKVKDKLNRDTDVSLFVHKCMQGRSPSSFRDDEGNKYSVEWQAYPGDISDDHLRGTDVASISMSQWTGDQREVIKGQFGITAPEAHLTIEKNGTESPVYFYGKEFTAKEQRELQKRLPSVRDGNRPLQYRTSADILRAITLAGDPARLSARRREIQNKLIAAGASQADITALLESGDAKAQARLAKIDADLTKRMVELNAEQKRVSADVAVLKRAYTEIARANSTDVEPLSAKQQHVFNNCEVMICSDAAQVGMNLGNSSEMIMYDTLGSPMAEAQRMTRCARMLPSVVPEKLMGSPRMEAKTRVKRDSEGNPVLGADNQPVRVPIKQLSDESVEEIGRLRARMDVAGLSAEDREDLQAKIDKISRDPANRVAVMVQATDELGRPIFEDDGPFTALRRAEGEIFKVNMDGRVHNPGTVEGIKLTSALGGGKLLNGDRVTLPQALDAITQTLLSKGAKKMAMRVQTAARMGPVECEKMLETLSKEVIPGTSDPYITYDPTLVSIPNPDEGTYGGSGLTTTTAITDAVRDWIDSQPQTVQDEIMKAGFVTTENGEASSHDAAGVYLAIRAQEILKWLEDNRGPVSEEMRGEEGGDVLTDNEITNRLIDMLTPMDRAILKEKKYLVNVRKLTAGGNVGQNIPYLVADVDEETGKSKATLEKLFTGYEREYPVSTERRTQTMQRARHRSFEDIIHACQSGVEFRAEGHFVTASANEIATISVVQQEAAVKKSWALARSALVFDLDALEAAWRK